MGSRRIEGPRAFCARLSRVPQGITIILAGFLPVFAIISMFPAVPTIIDHFKNDPTAGWKVPLLVSAPGLSIALMSPFAGVLVDRFGRRRLLLWSTALYGAAGIAPLFVDTLNEVFVSRLLVGVAEALILTITNALIGDYWRDEGRRDWLFLQGIVAPLFSTIALLGVGAVVAVQWNAVFLVYLIAVPIVVAMAAFVFEPTGDLDDPAVAPDGEGDGPFPWRDVAIGCTVTLFASVLYYVFIINGGMAWSEVGVTTPQAISRYTAVPTLFVLLGAFLFRLLGTAANVVQISMPVLLLGLGLAVMGLAPDWRMMVAGLTIQQVGAGMTVISLIAWVSGKLTFRHRGRGVGAFSSAFFLGQFVNPLIVHQLVKVTGTMQGAFLVMGVIGIASAGVALLLCTSWRPVPRRPAEL